MGKAMEMLLESVEKYEIAMLKYCEIKYIVPTQAVYQESGVRISVNDSYERFLDVKEKIELEDIRKIVSAIMELSYLLPNYLLDVKKVLFDEEMIMINEKGIPYFIYLANKTVTTNYRKDLNSMLINLLKRLEYNDQVATIIHSLNMQKVKGEFKIDEYKEIFELG